MLSSSLDISRPDFLGPGEDYSARNKESAAHKAPEHNIEDTISILKIKTLSLINISE